MARLEEMQTFIKVVETGSISGAAERLGVSKSAVSRRISELEERLGAQLLRRTTRRLNLTDTAQHFYNRCRQILADVQEAEDAVADEHGTLRGRLRVAVPFSFGMLHLGPAIDEFMQAHPLIEFDLDFNDRLVDLMTEDFDLALRIASLEDSSLKARRLAEIKSTVCASPDYLARNGTPQTPQDLCHHHCLTYSNLPAPDHWSFLDAKGNRHSVQVSSRLLSNNGNFTNQAAINGAGIVRQPRFICYKEVEAGLLVPLLTDYTSFSVNAYAVYPQTRHLSRRVRAFVDFLAERFSAQPYWDKPFT